MEEQKPITHIVPTVGRVVWYWPRLDGGPDALMAGVPSDHPLRADVCSAHPEFDGGWRVNLSVNDANGMPWQRVGVPLHQGDAAGCSQPRPFATWMPFQRGQAMKTAEAEAKAVGSFQTEHERLNLAMLAEQVRQIRLQNDAFEADMRVTPPADRTPEVPGIPPHQVRMRFERDELSVRLMKLRDFKAGREFAALDETEQELMHEQAEMMQGYLACLQDRIALFNEQQDAA